jgi:hypothetical protein
MLNYAVVALVMSPVARRVASLVVVARSYGARWKLDKMEYIVAQVN